MISNSIEEKITAAIAGIAAIAEQLPGVIIIHDLRNSTVIWISEKALKELGIEEKDIIGKNMDDYHYRFFNPEDAEDYVPRIFELLHRNNDEEIVTYFQQVRRVSDHSWTWHMSSTKIFMRDDKNTPILTITMSFPIDAMHHMAAKASRLLEENNFLRNNFNHFARLSQREREILRLMALGKSATESSELLFISQGTVETHRKNIKQKLGTGSYYELCKYAMAFDLV